MSARLVSGKKLVGVKQSRKALTEGRALVLYVAENADAALTRPLEELCKQSGCELVRVQTMRELGQLCGVSVGSAAAVLLGRP